MYGQFCIFPSSSVLCPIGTEDLCDVCEQTVRRQLIAQCQWTHSINIDYFCTFCLWAFMPQCIIIVTVIKHLFYTLLIQGQPINFPNRMVTARWQVHVVWMASCTEAGHGNVQVKLKYRWYKQQAESACDSYYRYFFRAD